MSETTGAFRRRGDMNEDWENAPRIDYQIMLWHTNQDRTWSS
jgi:hypothetical protein